MQTAIKYQSEIKTIKLGGKMITLENLTPILSPKERERRKKEIEKRLFDVFIKYKKMKRSNAKPATSLLHGAKNVIIYM